MYLLKIQAEIHITAVLIINLKGPNIHKKLHTSLSDCGFTYIYVQTYPYSHYTKQGISIQNMKLQQCNSNSYLHRIQIIFTMGKLRLSVLYRPLQKATKKKGTELNPISLVLQAFIPAKHCWLHFRSLYHVSAFH